MTQDQINKLVEKRNEQSVYELECRAQEFVTAIFREQSKISQCNKNIVELREELKKLEAVQVTTTQILG